MNNATDATPSATIERIKRTLPRRYRAEWRFRAYGILSITLAITALVLLFADIVGKGYTAFWQSSIKLEFHYDSAVLGINPDTDSDTWRAGNFDAMVKAALRQRFPDVGGRRDKRSMYAMVSDSAGYRLRNRLLADPSLLGKRETLWVLTRDAVDAYLKQSGDAIAAGALVNELQAGLLDALSHQGELASRFNSNFFTQGDSRNSEMAGILGATVGTLLTLAVTLLLSFPVGVAAAVYLEEFAPKNRLTDLIEVNINNLAAVPSIIFGLLGLAIFINMFGLPRSAPLVGGLVLTLMTLPTIIISSRAAITAVPPSLRDAALGMGASQLQVVTHHLLPNAMPGMLTGAIIGMARALGETAPLLMIGMVAFIVDVPGGLTDSASALPVQIYLWSDSPERGFTALTSAAILVLLVFLISMNTLAVVLRRRLEKRW